MTTRSLPAALRRALLLMLCLSCGAAQCLQAQTSSSDAPKGDDEMAARQIGRVRAPELAGGRGWLNTEQHLKLALERAKVGDLPLAFPGKVLADARGGRLFIADSNHHRVVVTRLDGTLLDIIGAGARD
ncbi:MAG: hypothetical protein LC802_12850 [Acidobacteria bacterium]|nr:hypothetical protein [Acidobacteriota bacterium]